MNLFRSFHFLAVVTIVVSGSAPASAQRITSSMDQDWRFLQADVLGAEQPAFDDSRWRRLNVPHDWSIAGPFSPTNKTGGAGAWLPSGVGWYRKAFALPADQQGRRVYVEFDGVMQNSEVWINGESLGRRPSGYVSFGYELTPHVKFGPGHTNILAVRADTAAQPASRWYSGAGIYRHVRLQITDLVHLEPAATFVTTPTVTSTSAVVRLATRVMNASAGEQALTVAATVYGPPGSAPDGRYACTAPAKSLTLPAGQSGDITLEVAIPWAPRAWSLEKPDLHEAQVRLLAAGRTLDEETIAFGVHQFEFRADTGFWLNGKNLKLYGACLHHDGGAFGAAVPRSVWERRLAQLRALGVNAIRTVHNAAAPEFLDLCDHMGFLVMDEFFDCWTVGKNPYDYHLFFNEWSRRDAADMVRRDRNHPSVVLYCIGNEIHDTPKPKLAIPIAKGLVEVCHENDPTRPVTQALFRPNVSGDYTNGLADLLDVIGTNYRDNELLAAQRAQPTRKIIGTEQRHDRETWLWLRDQPSHAGQFLWVGVDYLGESRHWPYIGYAGGLLDRTGEIKPMAYERQSWWSDKSMVRIVRRVAAKDLRPEDPGYGGEERRSQLQFADWTPRHPEAHEEIVEVYSNSDSVELFLNGQSLGAKLINADAAPRVWSVRYVPGVIRAVAKHAGQIVATDELRTAGKPARIDLATDRKQLAPHWDEVAFVNATIVDENGTPVPRAKDLIRFNLTGPGEIAAVDSADNASLEPFQAAERRAYGGRCVALVKAHGGSGPIILTATAPGLGTGKISLEVAAKSAK